MIRQGFNRFDQLYLRSIRGIAIALMAVLPFHAFLSTWMGTTVGPLWLWKSLRDIIIAVLALLLIGWVFARWRRVREIVRLPVSLLAISFTVLALLITVVNGVNQAQSLAGLAFGLRYILLFCIMLMTTWVLGISQTDKARSLQWLLGITTFLVVFGLIQVTVLPADFLAHFGYGADTIASVSIVDDNVDARRAFATLRGPNDYGAFMLIPFAIAIAMRKNSTSRFLLGGMASIGLILSSSRSAWLGALMIVGIKIVQTLYTRRTQKTMIAGVMTGGVIIVAIVGYLAVTVPALRLAIFHSSPSDTHLTEGSTDKHWQATSAGIDRLVAHPFGCGLGCAGPASFYGNDPKISENYFVQIGEETGIIGMITWISLFVVAMRYLYGYARSDEIALGLFLAGLGITIVGVFLHVWADDALSLLWWGLAGIVIGNQLAKKNKKRYHST